MTNQLTVRSNYIDMMINQYNSIQDENMKRQIMRLLQNAFNNYMRYTPLPRSMSRIDINQNLSDEVSIYRPIRTMPMPSRNDEWFVRSNELVITEPTYISLSRGDFSSDDDNSEWRTLIFDAIVISHLFGSISYGTNYSFTSSQEGDYRPSESIRNVMSLVDDLLNDYNPIINNPYTPDIIERNYMPNDSNNTCNICFEENILTHKPICCNNNDHSICKTCLDKLREAQCIFCKAIHT